MANIDKNVFALDTYVVALDENVYALDDGTINSPNRMHLESFYTHELRDFRKTMRIVMMD